MGATTTQNMIYGSPPLTRGPPSGSTASPPGLRITPAHAGTTILGYGSYQLLEDHPRSRGDHLDSPNHSKHALGSPPLTRGPLGLNSTLIGKDGITPAHAGTTLMKGYPWHQFKDHPRSRGDHFSSGGWLMVHEGSPPLTRGPLSKLWAFT